MLFNNSDLDITTPRIALSYLWLSLITYHHTKNSLYIYIINFRKLSKEIYVSLPSVAPTRGKAVFNFYSHLMTF